jgi:hypothetical protein
MHMLKERLQILVSTEQKRRLEAEARTRGESVGGLVREAIDEHYGKRKYTFSQAERHAAYERLISGPTIPFVTPEELNRIAEDAPAERFLKLAEQQD